MSERFTMVLPGTVEHLDGLVRPIAVRDLKTDAIGDIGGGVYFARQLEMIAAEVLREKRPVPSALALFPINTDVPKGARSFTRRMLEHLGHADMISAFGDDLPRVDVAASEETVQIRPGGAAYGYTIDDIEASRFAAANGGGAINLPTERGLAARTAIQEWLNDIAWYGKPEAGLYGVLTHPYIPRYAIGVNSSTTAVDTVALALSQAFNSVRDDSKEVEKADRMLLASKVYSLLSTRFRTNTDTTILEMVAKGCNIPMANIIPVHELNGAGDMAGGDLMIADRKDRLICGLVIPSAFEQRPAQERNLEYVINCIARTGGVESHYPQGMRIAEFDNAL